MTTSVDSTGSSGSAKKFYRAAENRFVDASFFSSKNLDRFQDLLSVCCTLTEEKKDSFVVWNLAHWVVA